MMYHTIIIVRTDLMYSIRDPKLNITSHQENIDYLIQDWCQGQKISNYYKNEKIQRST